MASRVFVNGKVFTGEGEDDFVDAFRVRDGRVDWTGSAADLPPSDPPGDVVDLGGATVVPGFLDVHTHLSFVAQTANSVPCTIPDVTSIDEIVDALRASDACGAGPDVWIEGWGWDESNLAEGRPVTRQDLDRVSTTQPVYVLRSDLHSAACNTRALELAGVTAATPDPEGGRFEREADGRTPNGVLTEFSARAAVEAVRAQPSFEHVVELIVAAGPHFLDHGIVACSDLLAPTGPIDMLEAVRAAASRGFAPQCQLYHPWSEIKALGCPPIAPDRKGGRVRVAGVKVLLDGSISNRTAWLRTPYRDSAEVGLRTLSDADLLDALDYARREGLQLAVHVMGDRSIEHLIDLVGDVEPWLDDRPSVRLEHATLLDAGLLARLRATPLRWGVATQVIFLFAEYEAYRANLTAEQLALAYPLADLEAALDAVALSSDAPATTWRDPDDVFVSLRAAVERRAHNGEPITPAQALTVGRAVRLYTARAARVSPFHDPVGVLAPGASADFVVLTRDLFTVPVDEIDGVRVAQTWLRGEKLYQR